MTLARVTVVRHWRAPRFPWIWPALAASHVVAYGPQLPNQVRLSRFARQRRNGRSLGTSSVHLICTARLAHMASEE